MTDALPGSSEVRLITKSLFSGVYLRLSPHLSAAAHFGDLSSAGGLGHCGASHPDATIPQQLQVVVETQHMPAVGHHHHHLRRMGITRLTTQRCPNASLGLGLQGTGTAGCRKPLQ